MNSEKSPNRANSVSSKVSIVTPTFNQGRFLEETIKSVVSQGYRDCEYIVIDGGSTDDSLSIIKKYERWITYWVSEKDGGQADAINKGLARCTGDIFQFINSDDYLAPGALAAVAKAMQGRDAVAGVVVDFNEQGARNLRRCRGLKPVNFIARPPGYLYHQPGVWLRTEHVKALGGFRSFYRYKFDWELQVRYLERWPNVAYIDDPLVYFRLHDNSKTVGEGRDFWPEELIARDLLYHEAVDPALRGALKRFVKRRHWRSRIDELLKLEGLSRSQALGRLCREALWDPFNRIDRYCLGAVRRIVAGSTPQ